MSEVDAVAGVGTLFGGVAAIITMNMGLSPLGAFACVLLASVVAYFI